MVRFPGATAWVPVAATERVIALDVLRGLAILGVLVANTLTFAYPTASAPPDLAAWRGTGPADAATVLLVALLVEGKFYTLLSILFGIGLVIQAERARSAGRRFVPFYLRRAALLFVLGVVHGVLLYAGDILAFYAIVSVTALPFRNLRARSLSAAAMICAAVGVATLSAFAWSHPMRPYPGPLDWSVSAGQLEERMNFIERGAAGALERGGLPRQQFFDVMRDEWRVYRSGSWLEITRARAVAALLLALPSKVLLLGPMVLSFFLLGMRLARSGLFVRLEDEMRPWYRSLLYGGVSMGLLLVVLAGGVQMLASRSALAPPLYWTGTFAGVLLQSLGYAGGMLLVCARWPRRLVVRGLAAVGRTALSNYLLQSVLLGFVFYSTGLALFTRLTALLVVALAVPVFAFEVWLSLAWLRARTMGPVEWIWRSLTYGRLLPLSVAGGQPRP